MTKKLVRNAAQKSSAGLRALIGVWVTEWFLEKTSHFHQLPSCKVIAKKVHQFVKKTYPDRRDIPKKFELLSSFGQVP